MYTPCSVAGRVSIATGPMVEEQLTATATVVAADDGNDGNVVVVVVVNVNVTVLHVHLLFTVYPELGWRALLVVVGGVADWHSVFVGWMTVVQSSFGSMLLMCE